MHFLPDVYVTCDVCKGKRYDRETLEVRYRDKSIADVLDMTVEEAADLFKAVPSIRDKMETLKRVGLGYVKVGQQATTLSGGEAQRVKLAKELSRRSTGRTLYILDEPTTGLHFHDVAQLLDVLHELVEQGNTMIVIEHNFEVVKTADWLVDMGPEGGDGGGEVVAEGIAGADRPQSEELHRPLSEAGAGAESQGRTAGGRVVPDEPARGDKIQGVSLARECPFPWLRSLGAPEPRIAGRDRPSLPQVGVGASSILDFDGAMGASLDDVAFQ